MAYPSRSARVRHARPEPLDSLEGEIPAAVASELIGS
jgi:hypothetical protein